MIMLALILAKCGGVYRNLPAPQWITQMVQKIRWILLLFGIVVAIAVAIQNNDAVDVKLLFFQATLSLSLLILVSAGIGFLFGALMTGMMLRSRKRKEKVSTEKSASDSKSSRTKADTAQTSATALDPEKK